MANADRPRGFRPEGKVKQIAIMESGSACYPGDFVSLAGDGQVDPSAAAADIMGLCLDYASGAGVKVRVSVDPSQVYVGQATAGQIDAQTDIGQTCDILGTGGDSTYKQSRQEIDSSSIGSSQQLMLLGLAPEANNAFGTNAAVRVKINANQIFGDTDVSAI
jgi:hypothetical protein